MNGQWAIGRRRTSDEAAVWSSQSPPPSGVSRLPGRSRYYGRSPNDFRPTSTAAGSLRSSTGASSDLERNIR